MNRDITIVFWMFVVVIVCYTAGLFLVSCNESQDDKNRKQLQRQLDSINDQFKADSIKTIRINKAMQSGLNYDQAKKQTEEIYK